jgi:hypothetical protein
VAQFTPEWVAQYGPDYSVKVTLMMDSISLRSVKQGLIGGFNSNLTLSSSAASFSALL